MPKPQRTAEEIESTRTRILEAAVDLIVDTGYNDFSMRKLANLLGITATTIYNYYRSKDDLYNHLLIRGFDALYEKLREARRGHSSPEQQLRAMIGVYTDYGLGEANFYNLMYAWHVPKFNDYVGTPMEPVARLQLESALKIPEIFFETIRALAGAQEKAISDEDAWFLLIHYWSQVHGFIAGCNNTNLYYIHPDPVSLKERHLNQIAAHFTKDISELENKREDKG